MRTTEIGIEGQKLTIAELDEVHDSVTGRALTGSWIWDSALLLSRWLVHFHINFEGKSVLELGAGAGLPGLTAAKFCGASRVVLTDVGPLLPGLVKNVEANELGDRAEVRELVWGSDELVLSELGEFDVVLMSDVFYDVEEMVALARTLRKVCKKGTAVWATSEVRFWTGDCLNELTCQGFGIVELPNGLGGDDMANRGEKGDDMFALYQLIPPAEENFDVAA